MSEFDDVSTPEGLLEVASNESITRSYLGNELKGVSNQQLEKLQKSLAYDEFPEGGWVDGVVSWRKAIG